MVYTQGENTIIPPYLEDVEAIMEAGIDGVLVNGFSGAQGGGILQALSNAADSLGATNFKMALNADMSSYTAAGIIDNITKLGNNPHYLKINGKPLLSTFGGANLGNAWWRDSVINPLVAAGHPVCFVPAFEDPWNISQNPNLPSQFPCADGFCNDGGPMGVPFPTTDSAYGGMVNYSSLTIMEQLAQALHTKGKLVMSMVTPYYWALCHSARQYYENRGGRGLSNQWASIVNNQHPEFVELFTWNDQSESSYFMPTKAFPLTQNNIPEFTHIGYFELNKYFVSWYKTGVKPTIVKDALFYFYRTQPKDAVPSNDTAYCKIAVQQPYHGVVLDDIWITTALTAAAELHVTTGGITKTYSVPVGMAYTDVPFTTGTQVLELWRNNVKIAAITGANITATPVCYDLCNTSGYVVAGGSTSATWTAPTTKWKSGYVADWFE
jgi:hypothetical protein